MWYYIGIGMVATPFAMLFMIVWLNGDWKFAIALYLGVVLLIVWLSAGVRLIGGEL